MLNTSRIILMLKFVCKIFVVLVFGVDVLYFVFETVFHCIVLAGLELCRQSWPQVHRDPTATAS